MSFDRHRCVLARYLPPFRTFEMSLPLAVAAWRRPSICGTMAPMARVDFTANLQRHLNCPVRQAEGRTVRAVLDQVFAEHQRLRSYILDDQGTLRRHIAIYVNGNRIADRIGMSDPIDDADEVFVFQALSGG
jgi:sulfur-carrier protein